MMAAVACSILRLLIQASAEGHDEARLRARLAELINLIWLLIPRDPVLSDRLRAIVPAHSERLKWHDAEDLADALEKLVGDGDEELTAELVKLRLVIARLGGIHSQMRIGRLAAEELRNRKSTRSRKLP